jgi:hypothetical protein
MRLSMLAQSALAQDLFSGQKLKDVLQLGVDVLVRFG